MSAAEMGWGSCPLPSCVLRGWQEDSQPCFICSAVTLGDLFRRSCSVKSARSSWELPDLREGRVKAISDSDGVSYPWYGNTTETVTLVGPTNKISRFSVSMNDNFYPSVTWAVPVSNSNVPLLTRIKRDQSFTTWLVAMNTTTKEKIILQTIKWRMRVDIEVDPMQLLGQRARLVGRTQQEQPRILSRMEPIPPNALVKPNANDAQVLMWRPKRGQPIVVIPPK
ncbi:protein FAM78B isoform X3 [Gallus gallus]|uniref:protein FAM78B isoform X3 n=1 Tax=Gallus gallus TaxID=9031 RepID=UPI000D63FDE9|nr:protein FAM78B isoform X3 [Gallus gallus]XP_040533887.1 protein FAM78B isoform X3 [Gallus gallus]|eukprot:XP_025008805.1 protein FAM78B isoform X2 [Gallus gallus]